MTAPCGDVDDRLRKEEEDLSDSGEEKYGRGAPRKDAKEYVVLSELFHSGD
jgi:hypothetical protein